MKLGSHLFSCASASETCPAQGSGCVQLCGLWEGRWVIWLEGGTSRSGRSLLP